MPLYCLLPLETEHLYYWVFGEYSLTAHRDVIGLLQRIDHTRLILLRNHSLLQFAHLLGQPNHPRILRFDYAVLVTDFAFE